MSPSSPAAATGVIRQRKTEAETGPRRVLITGATRGIGRAMALRIAREGYEVVITGRKPSPQADEVLNALKELGVKAHALFFDVTDRAAAQTALAGFTAEHGPFWGVILNAGINRDGPLAGMSEEDWDLVLETDLGGFYNVLKPLILPMARRRAGRIIVIGFRHHGHARPDQLFRRQGGPHRRGQGPFGRACLTRHHGQRHRSRRHRHRHGDGGGPRADSPLRPDAPPRKA